MSLGEDLSAPVHKGGPWQRVPETLPITLEVPCLQLMEHISFTSSFFDGFWFLVLCIIIVLLFLKKVKANPKPANWRVLDYFFRDAGNRTRAARPHASRTAIILRPEKEF